MTPGGLCCSQGAAIEAGAQVLPAGTAVARGRVAPSGDHSGEGWVPGGRWKGRVAGGKGWVPGGWGGTEGGGEETQFRTGVACRT